MTNRHEYEYQNLYMSDGENIGKKIAVLRLALHGKTYTEIVEKFPTSKGSLPLYYRRVIELLGCKEKQDIRNMRKDKNFWLDKLNTLEKDIRDKNKKVESLHSIKIKIAILIINGATYIDAGKAFNLSGQRAKDIFHILRRRSCHPSVCIDSVIARKYSLNEIRENKDYWVKQMIETAKLDGIELDYEQVKDLKVKKPQTTNDIKSMASYTNITIGKSENIGVKIGMFRLAINGYTYNEIALAFSIKPEAVYSNVKRIINMIGGENSPTIGIMRKEKRVWLDKVDSLEASFNDTPHISPLERNLKIALLIINGATYKDAGKAFDLGSANASRILHKLIRMCKHPSRVIDYEMACKCSLNEIRENKDYWIKQMGVLAKEEGISLEN